MTAVSFQRAIGSRWIVNVILAAALLSLFKCFNGNFLAASRLFFALGRRGMIVARAGNIHARYQTPSTAVLCVGFTTAICMLLGDAILVPITEVGSVASAIGWSAACASLLVLSRRRDRGLILSAAEKLLVIFALAVALAMALMKLFPLVPGHFTLYEWIVLAIWIAIGAVAGFRNLSRHPAMEPTIAARPR